MVNISGLSGAAPIWNEVMSTIYRSGVMPESVLPVPGGVSQQQICNIRGLRDPATTCPQQSEWFLDGPPMLPDGQGGLIPIQPQQPQPQQESEFGPRLVQRETSIWEADVRPLDDSQRNILMNQNPNVTVPPRYCLVPREVINQVFDARAQLFIAPPSNPALQRPAYRYAYNNGIPILPPAPCTGETILAFGPVDPGIQGIILSPTNGQTVSGAVPIYGVVNYPDGLQFDYYKLEVRGGPFPDWTTMGEVHYNEVTEPAVLETFYGDSVPSGQYEIRLWLQGVAPPDPYVVSINLVN